MDFKKGQTISLPITSLGASGEGVGTFEGLKIFVEGALPDEIVEVRLTDVKKNYAKAELSSILTASPERKEPSCPYFAKCGGCQLLHLNYEEQLKRKEQRVVDALHRIGHFTDFSVAPCVPSPNALGYRNKIQLPQGIGFYKKESHDIVPIERCLIHSDVGEKVFSKTRPFLKDFPDLRFLLIKSSLAQKESLLIFVTQKSQKQRLFALSKKMMEEIPEIAGIIENVNPKQNNVVLGSDFTPIAGRSFLYESLLGKSFKVSCSSFFQVNPLQAENLYRKALELAALDGTQKILDAYCGVGTLSLLAAECAKSVIGIECVSQAIDDAEENAKLNAISNCRFYCGTTEEMIATFLESEEPDVVFLNPPRKGCAPEVLRALVRKRPKKVIYISCDPATLARDLALLKAKGFSFSTFYPFDMFPQTMHVECAVSLA